MRITVHKTGLAKVAVQCSADTFVQGESWVPTGSPPREPVARKGKQIIVQSRQGQTELKGVVIFNLGYERQV